MRRVIGFTSREARPDTADVLQRQGMPLTGVVAPRLRALIAEAREVFDKLANPMAVFEEVSQSEFAAIYAGAGRNEPSTPVKDIVPRASAVALFAATIGADVEAAIRRRIHANDAALAFTLDAFASAAVERLADVVASLYLAEVGAGADGSSNPCVLPYSPGYCGWHITGQTALFERLRPQEIGVDLNDRCLMKPLKAVSGVLVAASRDVHVFHPTYPCCAGCASRGCRERMLAVSGQH